MPPQFLDRSITEAALARGLVNAVHVIDRLLARCLVHVSAARELLFDDVDFLDVL
jgi:hypothetical protein